MRLSIVTPVAISSIAFGFGIPLSQEEHTHSLSKRAVSPDASCGGANKYTCQGSQYGNCCSTHGYCGSTAAYCGTGCQSGFGTCTGTISTSTSPSPSPSTVVDCLGSHNVPNRLVSSPDFADLAKPYNLRLPYTPSVIVLPTTTQHISDAVLCAGKSGVKVQARGGGHSYASFSSGGQNGSMVINLENFNTITLDANGIATVGGGVRLGNLALAIYNNNNAKRALPHGTCPGVGLGGHSTHGGYGYSSRTWGLTLDTITAMDVTLANGSTVHTTSTSYPDIYYALRGAADSFGIVSTFYLATKPAPAAVVSWSFSIPNVFSSVSTATNTFLHIQNFAQNAAVIDRNIGFGIYMDGQTFRIGGTYFGSIDTFNNKIKPELLRGIATPSTSNVQSVDWLPSLSTLASPQPLNQPLTHYDAHDDFYAKSLTTPDPLNTTTLNSFFDYIIHNGINAPNPWFSIINLYGGPESQINVQPSSSSAYSDRTSLWGIQNYGYTAAVSAPFPSSAIIPFVNGLNDALTTAQPATKWGAIPNYVDPGLTSDQAHGVYYDESTYKRLLAIKNVADPGRLFWNPQAIGA